MRARMDVNRCAEQLNPRSLLLPKPCATFKSPEVRDGG
jgi:hypothetical protein